MLKQEICDNCGLSFTSKSRRAKYCLDCLEAVIKCKYCGNLFTGKFNRQYCNKTCSARSTRASKSEKTDAEREERVAKIIAEYGSLENYTIKRDYDQAIWDKIRPIVGSNNQRGKGKIRYTVFFDQYIHQNKMCPLCKREIDIDDISLDHILPLSKGGGNEKENIQAMHVWCNLFKRTSTMEEAINKYEGIYG